MTATASQPKKKKKTQPKDERLMDTSKAVQKGAGGSIKDNDKKKE